MFVCIHYMNIHDVCYRHHHHILYGFLSRKSLCLCFYVKKKMGIIRAVKISQSPFKTRDFSSCFFISKRKSPYNQVGGSYVIFISVQTFCNVTRYKCMCLGSTSSNNSSSLSRTLSL